MIMYVNHAPEQNQHTAAEANDTPLDSNLNLDRKFEGNQVRWMNVVERVVQSCRNWENIDPMFGNRVINPMRLSA